MRIREFSGLVNVLRVVGAAVAGLSLAFVLIVLVEIFSELVYPAPNGMNCTKEEMCAHVAAYPPWVLAVATSLWGATAFVSTWDARRLGNLGSGVFVGVLLLAALVLNVSMLPYYTWFKVLILVVVPVAVLLGLRCSRKAPSSVQLYSRPVAEESVPAR